MQRIEKNGSLSIIQAIPLDILARVMENFRERLHMCVARQGNRLVDIIFKK